MIVSQWKTGHAETANVNESKATATQSKYRTNLAFGSGAAVGKKLVKDQSKPRLPSSGFSPRRIHRYRTITRYHLTRLRKTNFK